MLKGVTKRIVEIKSPSSDYFERAVLYLRPDRPLPGESDCSRLAEEYLGSLEPASRKKIPRDLRPLAAVLAASLLISLCALAVLLILFTKI